MRRHPRSLALATALLPAGSLITGGAEAPQAPVAGAPVAEKKNPLSWTVSLAVKEIYDDNVFLQNAPAGTPGLTEQGSFVQSVTPQVGLSYRPTEAFGLVADYAPEFSWYLSESSEDNIAHRAKLNASGKAGDMKWEANNSFLGVDGSNQGPYWQNNQAPAAGGIPIRNRRDLFIYTSIAKIQYPVGDAFLRPNFYYTINNWGTEQKAEVLPGNLVYQNYVDRSDINGGLDVGLPVGDKSYAILGVRFGHQHQDELLGNPLEYSNDYERFLVGFEGQPLSWMKINALAGPDFRQYGPNVAPTFDREKVVAYADAGITLDVSKADAINLKVKYFQQPGFGGRSIYFDETYAVSWKHTFNAEWSTLLGFQAYSTDFQPSAQRDDWIFTPSAAVSWKPIKNLSLDLAYTFNDGMNMISSLPAAASDARAFTQNLVTLGAAYKFH